MNEITLLIADDNDRIRLVLERVLGMGKRTLLAGDGLQALEMTRAHLPDLLILDVNMPGRNGHEVCAELRADPRTRNIPILMLTGDGPGGDEHAGAEGGPDACLGKPFSLDELNGWVRTLLQKGE